MKNQILKTLLGLGLFGLVGAFSFLIGFYPMIAMYIIGACVTAFIIYAANIIGNLFWPHIKDILKKD